MSQSVYAQPCYDATWTLAKALDLTIKGNCKSHVSKCMQWLAIESGNLQYTPHTDIGDNSELNHRLRVYDNDLDLSADVDFALQHFSYNNSGVLNLVYGHLNRTNFTGITVRTCMCVMALYNTTMS